MKAYGKLGTAKKAEAKKAAKQKRKGVEGRRSRSRSR